jgi:hypothetical protein
VSSSGRIVVVNKLISPEEKFFEGEPLKYVFSRIRGESQYSPCLLLGC